MNYELLLTNEVFVGGLTTIATLIIKNAYDVWKAQRVQESQKHVDGTPKLEYHTIFEGTLKRNIGAVNSSFKLEDEGKTLVFREILLRKFEIWGKHLLDLAKEVDECNSDCKFIVECNKLENLNMKYFNLAMEEFSVFFLDSRYSTDERKCLEITLAKFGEWHGQRVQKMLDRIHEVCNDPYLASNCMIAQAIIFDDYIGQFAETMTDASKTLGAMNGDMNGLIFRGIKLGGIDALPHNPN